MLNLAVNGFTSEEILKELNYTRGSREISFRYELLNKDDGYLGDLSKVECQINQNSIAEIKRTAALSVQRSIADDIDWINERIKPYFRLKMPNGKYAEWPLGIFLLSSPSKEDGNKGKVERYIDAFDKAVILKEDKFLKRHLIPAGTNYVNAITTLINTAKIGKVNITPSPAVLEVPLEFEIGYPKLTAINELLESLNYYSLTFDEQGYAVSGPYIEPSLRKVDHEYRTNEISVIKKGAMQTLDLFNAPNIFVRVVTTPEREVLKSVFVNDNIASPLSTISRGRNIVDYKELDDIADQVTLDAYTRRQAINANQIYGEFKFTTALMPHHAFMDCLYVEHDNMLVNDIFIEKSWGMRLRAGGEMSHVIRKVVKL